MKNKKNHLKLVSNDEDGFVLALSLVVMAVLVVIGAAAMQTAMFELDIAGNDARQRESFYRSDAGLDITSELIEQELACKGVNGSLGFPIADDGVGAFVGEDKLYVVDTTDPLWMHEGGMNIIPNIPGGVVDVVYPYGRNSNGSVTVMTVNGIAAPIMGAAQQMAAGYEGTGYSAASGGVERKFYIYSQHVGATGTNVQATTMALWRHVVGSGAVCVYGSDYESTLKSLNTGAL